MRHLAAAWLVMAMMACASAPRGPTDEEVRTALDARLQEAASEVTMGNTEGVVGKFASDGVLALRGLMGPDGGMLNMDLAGADQIGSLLDGIGAAPGFVVEVTAFSRTASDAEQSGRWSVADGQQTGTFVVSWHQSDDGLWQIARWSLAGS